MDDLMAVVVAGPDLGVRMRLAGNVEIGTGPDADLELTDPSVSSRHARIYADGKKLRLEDLGSGVHLNGADIDRVRRLRAGDQVLVGATVIEVVSAQTAASLVPAGPGLRVSETSADFVPLEATEALSGPGGNRYGALATWTDSHVKRQTEIAAFGLLALSALAVYLFVF
jgi:predicted component of type VI protein secretion system